MAANVAKSAMVKPARPGQAGPHIIYEGCDGCRKRDAPKRVSPMSEDIKRGGVLPRMPDTIMPRPRALPPVIEDHCYLRHGDRELRARVFMPAFEGGPFPC